MKNLLFGLIVTILFVFTTNAQEKLSAEDQASLQQIVKKVTATAEEKGRIVTLDLVYKEGFTNPIFAVDENNKLATELAAGLDNKTFAAMKGNLNLTFSNGESVICVGDDFDCIGTTALKLLKEGTDRGIYMPNSLEGIFYDNTSRPVFLGHFNVHSFLMDQGNGGCFSVLTVVTYTDSDGTETVIAQSIVKVGSCGRLLSNNENEKCPDIEFKGDFFYNTKYQTKNCIVDLLKIDTVYRLYTQEKERVLTQIKK